MSNIYFDTKKHILTKSLNMKRSIWLAIIILLLLPSIVFGQGIIERKKTTQNTTTKQTTKVPTKQNSQKNQKTQAKQKTAAKSSTPSTQRKSNANNDKQLQESIKMGVVDENIIFIAVEKQAEFPGGLEVMTKWISNNINYPQTALANNIQGRVIVKFVVEKDGSIGDVRVVKGIDTDLDNEAVRVIKKMPRWTPGKNDGYPVRSYFTTPVSFKLPN